MRKTSRRQMKSPRKTKITNLRLAKKKASAFGGRDPKIALLKFFRRLDCHSNEGFKIHRCLAHPGKTPTLEVEGEKEK